MTFITISLNLLLNMIISTYIISEQINTCSIIPLCIHTILVLFIICALYFHYDAPRQFWGFCTNSWIVINLANQQVSSPKSIKTHLPLFGIYPFLACFSDFLIHYSILSLSQVHHLLDSHFYQQMTLFWFSTPAKPITVFFSIYHFLPLMLL